MAAYKNNREKILFLTQFSMLLAIEAIVCFTPLGSIISFGTIVATLGMVPVIITAIVLGTRAGTLMGFFTGLFSFIVWTFMPPSPMAFAFTPFYSVGNISGNAWSLVICFVPRILVGVVTGVLFNLFTKVFQKLKIKNVLIYGLSGLLGSLTNTFLVLGGIYLFFAHTFAIYLNTTSNNIVLGVISTTVLTNGIPEAIVGAIAAFGICLPLKKYLKRI